jgi:hypothetical protein
VRKRFGSLVNGTGRLPSIFLGLFWGSGKLISVFELVNY